MNRTATLLVVPVLTSFLATWTTTQAGDFPCDPDLDPPIISCPADMTVECGSDTTSQTTGMAEAFDDCDPPLISESDQTAPGQCGANVIITRTWVATDLAGNSASCVQTITTEDTTPPTVTCPADKTFECDGAGNTTDIDAWLALASGGDGCSQLVEVTNDFQGLIGGCGIPGVALVATTGSATVTFTATDDCGNSTTCSATVTVSDTTAPTITCPLDMTVECGTDTNSTTTGMATGSDLCNPDVTITESDVPVPGQCGSNVVITRTWVATDLCGNSASCVQTITTEDTTPPTVTCPADKTFECDGAGNVTDINDWLALVSASDSCSQQVTITDDFEGLSGGCEVPTLSLVSGTGSATVTFTATDACSNSATCSATVTIADTTAPAITCPADMTVECGSDTTSATTGMATGSDTCDAKVAISESDATAPGPCGNNLVITRTWVATDACGNSTSCVQTITTEDGTAPTLTAPHDVTIECDEDTSSANTGVATAADDCDDAPVVAESDSVEAGSCSEEQTITRTWTATDICGNSTSSDQVITVIDSTSPDLSMPPDVTVDCDESTLPADTGIAFATDNCFANPTVTLNETVAAGACPDEWVITRTWSAGDSCENTSTAVQTITVDDSTSPVITCPPDVTIECGTLTLPGNTGGLATATDNCDASPSVSSSDSVEAGPCGGVTVITRTWTATDNCNNTTSCAQIITVEDTASPSITCPGDVTILANADCDGTLPDFTGDAVVGDVCGLVSVKQSPLPGTVVEGPDSVEVTLTADDGCTTPSECSLNVTVVCRAKNDFDGDGVSDISVFDRTDATFYTQLSSSGTLGVAPLGETDDIPVPGDYDGDGITDPAVFDYATGNWTILDSSTGLERVQQFGYFDTVPTPGDYDGDGTTDFGVYERSTFTWYLLQSTAGFEVQPWGFGSVVPVACDYEGDGIDDIAVYDTAGGTWYIRQSRDGLRRIEPWGFPGVIPMPADYDGDELCDIAVYFPGFGRWYVLQSSDGTLRTEDLGDEFSEPVCGDYDGDHSADLSVFDTTTYTWFILRSNLGLLGQQWGYGLTDPALPQYQVNKEFGLH